MLWYGRGVTAGRLDQFPPVQAIQRSLHGALGKAGRFCEHTQTRGDRFPLGARGLAVKMQKDQIGSRLAIVADDVAHQHIEHVIIN